MHGQNHIKFVISCFLRNKFTTHAADFVVKWVQGAFTLYFCEHHTGTAKCSIQKPHHLFPALRIYDQWDICLSSNNKFARTRVQSLSSTPNLRPVYALILITCFFDRAYNPIPALRIYDQQDLFHSSNNKFAWKSIDLSSALRIYDQYIPQF
jgi:uncharacterized protein (DUF2237 family)